MKLCIMQEVNLSFEIIGNVLKVFDGDTYLCEVLITDSLDDACYMAIAEIYKDVDVEFRYFLIDINSDEEISGVYTPKT